MDLRTDELPPFDQWFDDSLKGRITAVRHRNYELVIDLTCQHPRRDQWLSCTISCVSVAESHVMPDVVEYFDVATSHPLLLSYSEPAYFLHFNSAPASVTAALGAMYLAHFAVIGKWRPFGYFLNQSMDMDMDIAALLEGGYGMLAQGPQSVMQAYQAALGDSMRTYLNIIAPWSTPAFPKKILLFDNEYYVICKDYHVEIMPLIDPPAG
jgi:hypothetical protein